ncbi:MAG: N-methyl-L-tryptophan oxidase [Phycisphaeraceae bacterium]|nr:N-methyl-L-tryptophan oxidase [Phycisphaeraceae bacterium]
MRRTCDVIVIGLGAMGSAACASLAASGLRVLGLEQFTRGHDRGSSHGGSRVVRWTYFEDPAYMPLLMRAREGWAEVEATSGQRLLDLCGVVYVGDPKGEVLEGVRRSGRDYGIAVEELDRDACRERLPWFAVPEGAAAILEPGGGFVRPEAAILAQLRLAEGHGAVIQEGEKVESIEEHGASVRVETVAEEYDAAAVVVTAGAWTGRLARACGADLRPTRQVMAWIDGSKAASESSMPPARADMPVWFFEDGPRGPFYGIPDRGASSERASGPFPPGAKVARHLPGEAIDPDAPRRAPTDEEVADLADAMRRLVPGASGPVSGSALCMYTMTADANFIIDRVPGTRAIFLAAGFSGHGFKFAPVVGEILTGLVARGGTGYDIGFLRADRFRARGSRG